MSKDIKIAIVGGGVAGVSSALYLGSLGLDVTLFENGDSLVSGPPFCHLHAGGNLYPDISDEQCVKLLKQSTQFLRFYPYVVDYRPTVIVLPTTDKRVPTDLLPRLELLQTEYEKLIELDSKNRVLGDSSEYFKLYTKEKLEKLKKEHSVKRPTSSDEWMIEVSKNIDFDQVQFPLILVQEYGLNLFRLAAGANLSLNSMKNITLKLSSTVLEIESRDGWIVHYSNDGESKSDSFDYLINVAGFKTGMIDDMVCVKCDKMVEFKAAYISQCNSYKDIAFPEIIFHGKRATPEGMGQFTPYPDGYFQLHGMTKDITLYDDGLVSSTKLSSQPKLNSDFMTKLEASWSLDEVETRTKKAVNHLAKFIPSFSRAHVASKPLFGAQQILGNDPELRVAEVSFDTKNYARCEIVKVSSALDMAKEIVKNLEDLSLIDKKLKFKDIDIPSEEDITTFAKEIAINRDYPSSLATINIPKADT